MPAFMPPHNAFHPVDYPPQYLQPKYDGPLDFHSSYYALSSTAAADADLDPYNHSKRTPSGPMYNSYATHYNDHAVLPSQQIGAPMIPPLQIDNRFVPHHGGGHGGRRRYETSSFKEQEAPDEKIVGGVSAQLDYEMELMTDFVVEMTISVVHPSTYERPMFRKWVLQVLNATRLPSATIVLSLSYLAIRVNGMTAKRQHFPSERSLYQMLTVALILGSKFLDDNTFQNKSWAEVSNISVKELNLDEMEWLAAFQHRLHHDPDVADGFSCWQTKWVSFKSRPAPPMAALLPLDTTMHRPRPERQSTSPARYQTHYPVSAMSSITLETSGNQGHFTPSYSPYQSWYGQRAGLNQSPPTAPHTGPNTPDYYSQSRWGPAPTQATRDPRLGYSSLPNSATEMGVYQPAYDAAVYNYGTSMWSCHGHTCQCSNCRHAQLLQPRYGSVLAA